MKLLLQISMCCLLAGSAAAQRHGGGGGGGFRGGSVSFGAGRSVFSGSGGNFLHPTTGPGISFRGGNFFGGRGFGGRGFFGRGNGYGSLFYPYGGGLGWWPDYYYDSYYVPDYYGPNGYGGGYASYQTSPNVTVIYPQPAEAPPPPPERAHPVTREYDQNGQEIRPGASSGSSPIYLIAFNDHVIHAAAAYWVDGKTLHYVTLQHEERTAGLDTVDRSLTLQLNRERQVPFQLPPQ
ncbi:MAG TPA: hypothetical protein VLY24_26835 [Bryobacteraceae bacterium]|nr:hypothetical protein [Bryobacteraceae bacterium]